MGFSEFLNIGLDAGHLRGGQPNASKWKLEIRAGNGRGIQPVRRNGSGITTQTPYVFVLNFRGVEGGNPKNG
jgi:hypothetical protein